MNNYLELQFSLRGKTLPADHGYALYSALKKYCQTEQISLLIENNFPDDILLCSVSGIANREGIIYLNQYSHFRLRCPADKAQLWYRALQNQVLDIRGHLVRLIQPRLTLLETSESLKARLVTFRLEHWNTQEAPFYFLESCKKALTNLEVKAQVSIDSNREGDLALRALKIQQKNILGYGVIVEGLSQEDSVKLQSLGLGGRKHFGCGWFYPTKEENNEL